ncbi:hypothetical protein [Lewinella sp. 4G2]|uniref:hypothetical protein n=1 Tax=Lewinella sp. 4G2 TaxID=1803372 RepID=UPI0007B4B218|nr:hypothetical protein [Lewinella sp. 4G2]OAV44494.1 hypothetical protein A3850_008315 [Lewinella sp. 4G2]
MTDQEVALLPDLPNPMDSGLYRTIPLAAVILGFATVAMLWGEIPDLIPMKNDLDPDDNLITKYVLWLVPVVNLAIFVLLKNAVKPSWQKYNVPLTPITPENAERQQRINLEMTAQVRLVICLLLAYIAYATAQSAAGLTKGMDMRIFWVLFVALFVVIGVQVYRSLRAK